MIHKQCDMEKHEKFLKQAIEMAKHNVNDGFGGPFGALVVKDVEVVGKGVNLVTSSNDPTAHAEIVAIRDACKNLDSFQLDDCILYASCEPCPMCLGAIYWARPKMLIFAAGHNDAAKAGFDDSFIYEEIKAPYDKRKIKTVKIQPDNYFSPFEEWIENENKIKY